MSKKKASRRSARASEVVHNGEGAERDFRSAATKAKRRESESAHEASDSGNAGDGREEKHVVAVDTNSFAYRWGGSIIGLILVGMVAVAMLLQVLTD